MGILCYPTAMERTVDRRLLRMAQVSADARDALERDSGDAGHGVDHHKAVVRNSIRIMEEEKMDGEVDYEAVLMAGWWHDYKKGDVQSNNAAIVESMVRQGCSDEEVSRVLAVVNSHSFGQEQDSLEARVLYDADKLEYLSLNRARAALRAVKEGKYAREDLERDRDEWVRRIPYVWENLHFETTREMFVERAREAYEALSDDEFWGEAVSVLPRICGFADDFEGELLGPNRFLGSSSDGRDGREGDDGDWLR